MGELQAASCEPASRAPRQRRPEAVLVLEGLVEDARRPDPQVQARQLDEGNGRARHVDLDPDQAQPLPLLAPAVPDPVAFEEQRQARDRERGLLALVLMADQGPRPAAPASRGDLPWRSGAAASRRPRQPAAGRIATGRRAPCGAASSAPARCS